MYKALSVASYIIQRCNSQNKTISNLKLQKILYFVQAEFLVTKNQPCFAEEIQAWDFGPVVPIVYQKYKVFGGANIPVLGKFKKDTIISKYDQNLINDIMDECTQYPTSILVKITQHQTPWEKAYYTGVSNVISLKSIKKYFSEE